MQFLSASLAVLLAGLAFLYREHVPRDNHPLPSFRALETTRPDLYEKLQQIYPADFYEGGGYAQMPFGETRYYLFGPEKGHHIVLIHGIGPPCSIFKRVAMRLAQNGFRVLLFDLFGRGYSESPGALHDENLYTAQLALLLHHVEWSRYIVFGYSMGAAIAVSFTSIYPHHVDALILASPAGLMDEIPITGRIFSLPVVGELLTLTKVANYLMKRSSTSNSKIAVGSAKPVRDSTMSEESYDTALEQWRLVNIVTFQIDHHPGLQRSFLSTTRYFPFTRSERLLESFKSIGSNTTNDFPVEVIWGTADDLIPMRIWSYMASLIPHANLVEIKDGGHNIVVENSTAVSTAIINFAERVKHSFRSDSYPKQ